MIIMRLLTTLRVSPLSGGGAKSNPARLPRVPPFALFSPWEPEHEQTD
jgi:hypothetical protein